MYLRRFALPGLAGDAVLKGSMQDPGAGQAAAWPAPPARMSSFRAYIFRGSSLRRPGPGLPGSPLLGGYVLLVTVRVLLAFAAALADSPDEVDDQDSEDGVVSSVQPVLARCHGRHFLPLICRPGRRDQSRRA